MEKIEIMRKLKPLLEQNPFQPESTWEDLLDALVRDFTSVGFMSKSEARMRLKEIIDISLQEQQAKHRCDKGLYEDSSN